MNVEVLPSVEARTNAALWFAGQGFGVFSVWSADGHGVCRCPAGKACTSPGKHPMTAKGFLDATTVPERIETLLSAGSQPNYGLTPPEGVFALDIDGDGIGRLAELERLYGPLPETLRTRTASGCHVFLRWPTAVPRPRGQMFGFVTRWGSGRGAGYVIGPKSVHPSGVVYELDGDSVDIAELPEVWVKAATEPASDVITVKAGGDPAEVTEGHRHDFLRDKARLYAGVIRDPDVLRAAMLAENAKLPEPKTEADVERAIGDVLAKFPPDAAAVAPDDCIVGIDAYTSGVPATVPWICKPVAYVGGVTLIAGPPKGGKSTFAADLQRCRETGEELLGVWDVTAGPTLLVTEEGGVAVIYKTAGLHKLYVLDRQTALRRGLKFADVLQLIGRWAESNAGGLVFIDTLAIWAGIADENDASAVTAALDAVTALAQRAELAIVLVHHTRKSGGEHGEAIRGSGAMLGTVDLGLELTRTGDERYPDERYLTVQGRVILPERHRLGFDRLTRTYGLVDDAERAESETEDDLAGVPLDGPGMTRDELRNVWGKDPRTRIEKYLRAGRLRVQRVDERHTHILRYWRLPSRSLWSGDE